MLPVHGRDHPCPPALDFRAPSLELIAQAAQSIISTPRKLPLGNDMNIANMFLFAQKYGIELALEEGILYRHYSENTRFLGYGFPYGTQDEASLEQALQRIESDAVTRQRPADFCLLTAEERDLLMRLRPSLYSIDTNRADSDYIYLRQSLAELPGTRYHKKRNRLSQTLRELEKRKLDYTTIQLDPAQHRDHIISLARDWQQHESDAKNTALELASMETALTNWEALGLQGLGLMLEGKLRSFSIFSYSRPDALNTHFEKTHPDWRFLYPLINKQTALHSSRATLINREEDLGLAGLRQAKLSYHPHLILDKYRATREEALLAPTC